MNTNQTSDCKISAGTIARTVCLLLALVNQILVIFGKSPLPIEDGQIVALISTLATVITAVISWWKNNSLTPPALEADKLLRRLKGDSHG